MNLIPSFIHRRIRHRPNLVKIVDNIGWLLFDRVLRMGVGLFVGVWIARYLGPEQFGLLNFAIAFIGLFGALATLGLRGIVVRDLIHDPAGKEEILGTAALLQSAGGLLAYVLIIIVIFLIRPDDPLAKTLVAIIGLMMLFKVSDVAVYWFESQVQSKYTVWVQNSVFIVFAVIKVGLILNDAPLVAFAWATMAEAGFVTIILLKVLSLRGPKLRQLQGSFRRAKTLFADSWPGALSGIVLMVQARIDQVMLGEMIGVREVGYYSVALNIIETAAFGAMLLYSTFLPSFTQSKKVCEEAYMHRLEFFYKLNIVMALFIVFPLAIFSVPIISFLFGDEYSPVAAIMSLMTIRLIFAHIGVPRSIYLLNENLLRYSALTMIVGTIVNIILNYFLIPLYAGVGAVIASLTSFLISIFILDLFYSRTQQNALIMLKSLLTFWSIFRKKSWVL